MVFAILAGGEGSRLAAEGVAVAKPLAEVGGEALVDRLACMCAEAGASRILLAYRRGTAGMAAHVKEMERQGAGDAHVAVESVEVDTPSPMHTLLALADKLSGCPMCVVTVDTVIGDEAFARYAAALSAMMSCGGAVGLMGVTGYVDDEKPLYVAVDDDMRITAFCDDNADGRCRYVSAGVYGLSAGAMDVLRRCVDSGRRRMRDFQRALLDEGFRLEAFDMGMVFDIDHASDIDKANRYLGGRL